jgi:hypothetical protein
MRRRSAILPLLMATLGLARGTAAADDEGIPPLRGWTRGVFLAVGAGSVGGLDYGGAGLAFELARGRGRWQAFGAGQVAFAAVGAPTSPTSPTSPEPPEPAAPPPDSVNGLRVRLGAGLRAIVRSMQPDGSAAIEMFVEGGAGVERFWWNGGGVLTRPDLSIGGGLQIRAFDWPIATVRFGMAVQVAAPVDDASTGLVCRGACTTGDTGLESAFITNFGASW